MERFRAIYLAFLLLVTIESSHQRSNASSSTYTAAVVEYSPSLNVTMQTLTEHIQENVEAYSQFTKKAAEADADIIVFPECGLASLALPRNPDGSPAFSVNVPVSTGSTIINPCVDTTGDFAEALKNLSCSARENGIYMVVNLPEREECLAASLSCHQSGAIYYNTNVAFDREGNIIARYRKTHLFGEAGFTPSPVAETVIFGTDFGVRFGMFICFDLMFEEPAVQLVRDIGITDIIFPTAWFSELPFLTAIQAQAAWAHATDVNFLASGYNYPPIGSGGSGIYNGKKGAIVSIMPQTSNSYLLVASVPKKTTAEEHEYIPKGFIIPFNKIVKSNHKLSVSAEAYPLKAMENIPGTYYTHKVNAKNISPKQQQRSLSQPCEEESTSLLVHGDGISKEKLESNNSRMYLKRETLTNYATFVLSSEILRGNEQVFELCHAAFCCNFKITPQNNVEGDSYYVYRLAAYDGSRTFSGVTDGGLEVCAIITCSDDDFSSCGRLSSDTDMKYRHFQNIEISGIFNSNHSLPTPNTLLDADLMPLPVTSYTFQTEEVSESKVQVIMKSEVNVTFLTFGVYSRNFLNDTTSY